MAVIIGVNPLKKKRGKKTAPKKRGKTPRTKRGASMAAKKKARRKAPKTRTRTKTITRWRTRKAPKRAAKRVRAKSSDPLEIRKVVRGAVSVGIGMIIAKAAVNKLTKGGSETERWTWPNIAVAAVAGIAAGFALGAVFGLRAQTVTLIALGGVGLAMYKAFTTKLAPKWGWTESWFGAEEDDINPALMGYDGYDGYDGDDDVDVYDYEQQIAAMGATDSGGLMVPVNPTMGATDSGGLMVPANPTMGSVDTMRAINKRQQNAYVGAY